MADDAGGDPLFDANMCPQCFYDIGTFKYCCDSGRPHRPVVCGDCDADFEGGYGTVSKFCTATGRPHRDARTRDVPAADLAATQCPFCLYDKAVHAWCTETGWSHATLEASYTQFRNRKRTHPQSPSPSPPPANGVPASNGDGSGVAPRPAVFRAAPVVGPPDPKRLRVTPPVPTARAPGTPPAVVPASGGSAFGVPAPRGGLVLPPALPKPAVMQPQITDASFLMSGITPTMKILCVGEGNFSFSRTLCKRVYGDASWGNMLATDLELLAGPNNPGHQFTAANALELLKRGAAVKTGVNATKVHACLPLIPAGIFDLMTFQFPHNADKNFPFYPYPKGLPLESVGSHRELLSGFLRQAAIMLREGGRACITTKTSEPYKSWEIDTLAEAPMWFTKGDVFDTAKWAQLGYTHINTVNKCQTSIEGALTYIFVKDSSGVAEPIPGFDASR